MTIDLVAAREKAMTDPVWFAQNILNLRPMGDEPTLKENPDESWELDEWTKHLLNAAADVVRHYHNLPTVVNHDAKNQISVRSMHGPGKTFGLACLMHWFGFCFKSKIPCTAPKMAQLKSRLWPEFRKIRNRAIPGYKQLMRVSGQSIHWMDSEGKYEEGTWAFQETAAAPENLAGLHDRFMMICVDEASGVSEALWPVIESAISTGVILLLVIISNPTKTTGTFADTHLKEKVAQDWYQLHIRLEDTARVKRDWVKRMVNKYGKDSPVVRVRCYGEFAEDDANQLISLGWIADARNREFAPDGSIPRKRLSADCSDGGTDFTVITYAEEYDSFTRLVKQQQFSWPAGRAHNLLCDELESWWEAFGMNKDANDDIVIDALGVGAGAVSEMLERDYPVIRYVGGSSSDDTKKWRDRRSQSYIVLKDRFRLGRIVIEDDFVEDDEWDDVEGQLCSIRRNDSTERVEDIITKKKMKDEGIDSPDRADSIAMLMATQSPMFGPLRAEDFIIMQSLQSAGHDTRIS